MNEKEEHEEHTEQKDVLVCLDPKDLPHVFSQQQSSLVPVAELNRVLQQQSAVILPELDLQTTRVQC